MKVLRSRRPSGLASVEPDVSLSRWRIFETDDGVKRLVADNSFGQGCVSSALLSLYYQPMHAKTSDGLTYRLVGKPRGFGDIVDVWDTWLEANSAGVVKDVAEQLLAKSAGDDDA